MKIGIIQASSQAGKNRLLFDTVKKYAVNDEVISKEHRRTMLINVLAIAGL